MISRFLISVFYTAVVFNVASIREKHKPLLLIRPGVVHAYAPISAENGYVSKAGMHPKKNVIWA